MMIAETLRSRVLHTDDTPVEMQEPATRKLRTARLWVYVGAAAHPYNVFDFTTSRKRDGPQQFLKTYQGYLQADAFSGYDCLYLPAPGDGLARIIEVACHAHARRKFYEARTSDALRSVQALGYYRMLYALERPAADFEETGRHRMRQEIALPILEQFHAWLVAERPKVLPKSPLGEAISYALNNWTALLRYTEAGCLAIGRVERWRGGLGSGMSGYPGFPFVAQNHKPCSVSTSRSSNRTCRFPASGSHSDPQAFAFGMAVRRSGMGNSPSSS
jgi:hypothetical protein